MVVGKASPHGGNIQVISSPRMVVVTSSVHPGGEHDLTFLKAHPQILAALSEWTGDNLPVPRRFGLLRRTEYRPHRGLAEGQNGHSQRRNTSKGLKCLVAPLPRHN